MSKAIHCQCIKKGRICGNIIGVIKGDKIVSRRHGRTFEIPVIAGISITCERCGGVTTFTGE